MKSDFLIGDKVRLLLEDQFFSGIAQEDAARLRSLIGSEWTVSGHSEHGHVEIEFMHTSQSPTPLE
jgi:hypothetical protein